jgi:hypothetical protein
MRAVPGRPRSRARAVVALGLLLTAAGPASAQRLGVPALGARDPQASQIAAPPSPADEPGPTPTTSVSFIDSAVPFSHVRLRLDAGYDNIRPTRAEYLYPKGGLPFSPGPPLPETRVDAQQFSAYLEMALGGSFSLFVQTPFKWVNPEVNPSASGLGDMELGGKFAFISTGDLTTTFQLRLTVPSRSGSELSIYHWAIEPALLLNYRLMEYLTLEGELRYWASLGGKDFAGDLVRYGLGLAWGEHLQQGFWINPVAEVVGWTVVSGRELEVWSPTAFAVKQSAGETILNGALGVRLGWGSRLDGYVGYGQALTGDAWYRQFWRAELRLIF